MLSFPDIPQKQRSLFFDLRGLVAKGTLGLKKAFGHFWPTNLSRPSAAKA